MQEFFSKTFYGNTVGNWAVALLIIIASLIISKLVYYIITKIVKGYTKKSKGRFDDIIVDMVEEPVVFAIIIVGVWYGIAYLDLSENFGKFIGKVYYVLITFNVAWLVSRLFDALVNEYLAPRVKQSESDLDDQLLPIARKGIKVTIWIIAIVVGLNNAGYDVGALIAGLGLGGLAFAMAAKDSVANLFGGFTVFTDKPFKIHDRIVVHGFDGTVEEIGIRSTRLKTLAGRIVTIPNAVFASEAIENISSEPGRKIIVDLGLTYDTTAEQLEKAMLIVKNIAIENQDVADEDIVSTFLEFADSALVIRLIYYIKKDSGIYDTMSAVNMEILKQFTKAGLDFAFPSQTIYTKQA